MKPLNGQVISKLNESQSFNPTESIPTPGGLAPTSLLEAALAYALRGWSVFPCHTPAQTASGCSCANKECSHQGKHPRVLKGHHAATTEAAQIREWWRMWPDANIGIATGPSQLFVVEIDHQDGGLETWRSLCQAHNLHADPTAPGCIVTSGGGGKHIYYHRPEDCQLTIANSKSGVSLGPGIDFRAGAGYVIAPPSLHRSGRRYTWARYAPTLPTLPAWIPEVIEQQRREKAPELSGEMLRLRGAERISTGQRHRYLLNVAASLRHQGFDQATILAALHAENTKCEPPKSAEELSSIAAWISQKPVGRALDTMLTHPGLLPKEAEAATEQAPAILTLEAYRSEIEQIYHNGLPRGASTGWTALDQLFTVLHGGLTVISGYSTMGKTAFLSALLCNLAAEQKWKFGLFIPEMRPYASYFFRLAETWKTQPFSRWVPGRASAQELDEAITGMAEYLFPLDACGDAAFTFDWFIDSLCRVDDACKLDAVIVDHWMKLIHPAPRHGEHRSDVVIRQVNQLKQLCELRQIHCFLVVHPRSLPRGKDGRLPVADIDDLPDSRGWPALIDNFIIPHRDKAAGDNRVTIHVRKRKPWWIGAEGECDLFYDALTGAYTESVVTGNFVQEVFDDYKTRAANDSATRAADDSARLTDSEIFGADVEPGFKAPF
jgi:hypothetical protein